LQHHKPSLLALLPLSHDDINSLHAFVLTGDNFGYEVKEIYTDSSPGINLQRGVIHLQAMFKKAYKL